MFGSNNRRLSAAQMLSGLKRLSLNSLAASLHQSNNTSGRFSVVSAFGLSASSRKHNRRILQPMDARSQQRRWTLAFCNLRQETRYRDWVLQSNARALRKVAPRAALLCGPVHLRFAPKLPYVQQQAKSPAAHD